MTAPLPTDELISARPAPIPLFPVDPIEATDPVWQLPAPRREVPMRLRIDRGRPRFNRYTRHLHARRDHLDDRD